MKIVIDNQTLAEIISGHPAVNSPELYDKCGKITDNILNIWSLGWRPAKPDQEWIKWRPRELNTTADTECNLAMNYQGGHHTTYDHYELPRNIPAQSDAGCRTHSL